METEQTNEKQFGSFPLTGLDDESPVRVLGQPIEPNEDRAKENLLKSLASSNVREVVSRSGIRFGRRIGGGYYSDVYRICSKSNHFGTNRKLLLKIVNAERCPKISNYENELTICKLIKKCPNPYLVTIIDLYEWPREQFWLVMPHEGYELSKFLLKVRSPPGRLPECVGRDLFKQLAEALAYLHRINVVHRDIKPENVLISKSKNDESLNYNVKLIDFGFSKLIETRRDPTQPALCMSHKGSLEFMAPELLINCLFYDAIASDVYSLGVLLFYMLHGYGPWYLPNGGSLGSSRSLATLLDTYHRLKLEPIVFPQLSTNNKSRKANLTISTEAQDLIRSILEPHEPKDRPTLTQIISHQWMTNSN